MFNAMKPLNMKPSSSSENALKLAYDNVGGQKKFFARSAREFPSFYNVEMKQIPGVIPRSPIHEEEREEE